MAASASDYFIKVTANFSTVIGSGGVASGSATTIPLDSVSGLPTDTAIELVINRIDSTEAITNNFETVRGVISGSNLTSVVRGVEGTAQAWDAGVTVEYLVTGDIQNRMVTGILVEHNQNGTHKAITTDSVTSQTTNGDLTLDADGTGKINLNPDDINLAGTNPNIQVGDADPKRGIYIPASGMFAATTSGAATGQIETSTNKINVKVLDFDASADEYAWFSIPAPSYWDLGTVTAEFHWTAASGSGDVIWGIAGLARSNDDALDTALGTAVTVTDTLITANDEHLTADTSAITIGGTPAKDDYLLVRVYRDADAGGDTLNADARLLGVTIRFGVGQYDDQ